MALALASIAGATSLMATVEDMAKWSEADEVRAVRFGTAAVFRRIALGLTGAVEQAHHGHPDFRVKGRIFATLGYPDNSQGMVALTPAQQAEYVNSHATLFEPAAGAWGRQGATLVKLGAVEEETLGETLTLAWKNAVAKSAKRTKKK